MIERKGVSTPSQTEVGIPQPRQETVVFGGTTSMPQDAGTRVPESRKPEVKEEYNPNLDRLRSKDISEWNRWVTDRRPALLRRAQSKVGGHRQTAEDMVQDAWGRVYRAVTKEGSTVTGENLNGLIQRTLGNIAIDHYKAGRNQLEIVTDMTPASIQEEQVRIVGKIASPNVEETVLARIANEELSEKIKRLTPEQQEIILKDLKGKSIAEIAESVGRKEGAVKALKYRATRSLRRFLEMDRQEIHEDTPDVLVDTLSSKGLHEVSLKKLVKATGLSHAVVSKVLKGQPVSRKVLEKFIRGTAQQGLGYDHEIDPLLDKLDAMQEKDA